MPLDIVREVADVDTAVLLGVLTVVHWGSVGLVAAGRSAVAVAVGG